MTRLDRACCAACFALCAAAAWMVVNPDQFTAGVYAALDAALGLVARMLA